MHVAYVVQCVHVVRLNACTEHVWCNVCTKLGMCVCNVCTKQMCTNECMNLSLPRLSCDVLVALGDVITCMHMITGPATPTGASVSCPAASSSGSFHCTVVPTLAGAQVFAVASALTFSVSTAGQLI